MLQSSIWSENAARPNDDKIRAHCRAASAELGLRLQRAGHLEPIPAPHRLARPVQPKREHVAVVQPPAKRSFGQRGGQLAQALPVPVTAGQRLLLPTSGSNVRSRLARRACWVPVRHGWRHAAAHIARCHGFTLEEAFKGRGTRAHWRARGHVYFALRIGFSFTLPQIGKRVGRDHSTVLSGLRAHLARLPDV